jgi:hypothetical protein
MNTFRITSTRTDLPAQKTTVAVEVIATTGAVTQIKERLELSFDYAAVHGSEELNAAVEKTLTDAGFLA